MGLFHHVAHTGCNKKSVFWDEALSSPSSVELQKMLGAPPPYVAYAYFCQGGHKLSEKYASYPATFFARKLVIHVRSTCSGHIAPGASTCGVGVVPLETRNERGVTVSPLANERGVTVSPLVTLMWIFQCLSRAFASDCQSVSMTTGRSRPSPCVVRWPWHSCDTFWREPPR